jgi:hypothetical protein
LSWAISMMAGNLVEIRLPEIHVQSRKCLRKFTIQRDKIAGVISLPLASTQRIFSFHDVWNVLFRLIISYLWPFVSCVFFRYVIYCCQYHEPLLTLKTRGSAHWACIAHLTIEWYWSKFQREIIITLKNNSHLEWRVGLSDTILKGTHQGTIYAKFGLYIDASCQVWLYLAKLFQRRRFF